MPITVLCLQKKASVLPELTKDTQLNQVTLGELKKAAQKAFDLKDVPVRMVYAGAMMKNDTASLASYGINFRSKIVMIPTQSREPQSENGQVADSESLPLTGFEKLALKQIDDIVKNAKAETSKTVSEFPTLTGEFIKTYPSPLTSPEYISNHRSLEKTYFYSHEKLLKGLMQLDAVSASDPEQPDQPLSVKIRDHRKAAVYQLESSLDQLDHLWAQLKKTHPKP